MAATSQPSTSTSPVFDPEKEATTSTPTQRGDQELCCDCNEPLIHHLGKVIYAVCPSCLHRAHVKHVGRTPLEVQAWVCRPCQDRTVVQSHLLSAGDDQFHDASANQEHTVRVRTLVDGVEVDDDELA